MGNTLQTPQQHVQTPHHHHHHQDEEEPPNPETQIVNHETYIEPIVSPNRIFKNRDLCTHPFCVDCIIKYLQFKLEEDNTAEIQCPALHCTHSLDPLHCRTILPLQTFVKWCDLLCDALVLSHDWCYCPYQNCSVLIINECRDKNVKSSKCPNCKRLFCFKCKLPWHAGFRCGESGEPREINDVVFGILAEQNKWMRCPRCRHFVELIEGCNIIRCRCRTSFCYQCGRKVKMHFCDCDEASRRCLAELKFFAAITFALAICLFLLWVFRKCTAE